MPYPIDKKLVIAVASSAFASLQCATWYDANECRTEVFVDLVLKLVRW